MGSEMETLYTIEMVVNAMAAYCEHTGDSTVRNKEASIYLDNYQNSRMTWHISTELLCSMDKSEEILGLAAVTLRNKIRNDIAELSPNHHMVLFHRLIIFLKQAMSQGMQKLVRQISVAIADLLLRMEVKDIIPICLKSLSPVGLSGLFHVLEVLPLEAATLNEIGQLMKETDTFLNYLTSLHTKPNFDMVGTSRRCLVAFTSWIRLNLFPLDRLMDHVVIYNAFYILMREDTFNLSQEASDCIVALLEHVSFLKRTQIVNKKLFYQIYADCSSIKFPDAPQAVKKRKEVASLYIQLADTYAGLSVLDGPSALLVRGPECFERLLQIAYQCNKDVLISSMPMWHKLFDHLPFRFENELSTIFSPIILCALDAFFRQCRLPDKILIRGSQDYETLMELRVHLSEMLPSVGNIEEIISLTNFMHYLLKTAMDVNSYWSDMEASLFFMTPLIPKLLSKHRQIIVQMVAVLPSHLANPQIHPDVRLQMIALNTQCHIYIDDQVQRIQFIEQLLSLLDLLELSDNWTLLEAIVNSYNVLCQSRPDDLLNYENVFSMLSDKLKLGQAMSAVTPITTAGKFS